MPDTLTIPAPLARPVAEAAYTLLGRASSSVLRCTESKDRRAEIFEGPFRQFDAMRRLIEALGPIEPGPGCDLSDEHAPALADALREAGPLLIALAHTAHEEGDTEQAREYTAELAALTEYADAVRAGHYGRMAREAGDELADDARNALEEYARRRGANAGGHGDRRGAGGAGRPREGRRTG